MSGSPRLLLLDSASLYYRAFFGVPSSVTAPDGRPVNAVRGFLDMTTTLVSQSRPNRLVACWDDDWRPAFRVAALPSYKAHRVSSESPDAEDSPPDLGPQVPVIVDVLAALGVARVGHPGYEADDVIGTLAERAAGQGVPVDIVTGDRDLFQLVDDARQVRVLYTGKGVRNLEVVDQTRLVTRYDVPTGRAYAEMAILRGDPSDGLPGVPGIGEKTAVGLLRRFGGLKGLRAAVDRQDPTLSTSQISRLTDARAYLAVAPTVVDIVRDIAITPVADHVPATPADPAALETLARTWGLRSSIDRLVDALSSLSG